MARVRSGEKLKEYRQSYNYRAEYFKRNPGLFGHIWFCSQCYKPLFGKNNVIIDHIIPLSKGGRNHVSNCTAICRKCNLRKSDKIDGRIAKGYIYKSIESTLFTGQRGISAGVGMTVGLTARIFGAVFKMLGFTIKVVTIPLRKGNLTSRAMFLLIYILGVLYLLYNYTSVFNAWL